MMQLLTDFTDALWLALRMYAWALGFLFGVLIVGMPFSIMAKVKKARPKSKTP